MRKLLAAALGLALVAASARAAPSPKATPRDDPVTRAVILQTLLLLGMRPGAAVPVGEHTYAIESIEVVFGPDGAPAVTVKLKLLR